MKRSLAQVSHWGAVMCQSPLSSVYVPRGRSEPPTKHLCVLLVLKSGELREEWEALREQHRRESEAAEWRESRELIEVGRAGGSSCRSLNGPAYRYYGKISFSWSHLCLPLVAH